MPEPNSPLTTAELARCETCSLAWWYDRTHPLAAASVDELTRKLAIFTAVYGPGATELPEYHLLLNLKEQQQQHLSIGVLPPEPIIPSGQPQWLLGCVIAVVASIMLLVVVSIFLAVRP